MPAASVKLNYAIGARITPWDGPAITVALPAGSQIQEGNRVPGGWVLTTGRGDETPQVWWQPDSGPARLIGPVIGNWLVSGDGRTLVIADGNWEVTAYRLPTVEKFASAKFEVGMGPLVLGVAGDWAVLRGASGDGSATVAGAWNMSTGAVERTPDDVFVWGMSDDGRVLRRTITPSCLDVVAITSLTNLGRSGLCSPEIAGPGTFGSLSPDGATVVLSRYEKDSVVLRTADIRAGAWRPAAVPTTWGASDWDSPTSYLGQTQSGELLRCTNTTCTPIALPGLPPDVAIITNRGR